MADDDEREWRFSVDEVGPDDPDEDAPDGPDEDAGADGVRYVGEDDDGPTFGVATGDTDVADDEAADGEEGSGNVAGELLPERPVEPGSPDPENVVFTTAGAIFTALVFAAVLRPLDPPLVVNIVGSIGLVAGLLYVVFRRF